MVIRILSHQNNFLVNLPDRDKEIDNSVYLFGYNGTARIINLLSGKYKKTVIIEEAKNEDPKPKMQGKIEPTIEIPLETFINHGKSVSKGKCINMTNYIFLYKASKSDGSSGGPIFDSEGRLLGINFGNIFFFFKI